MASANAGINQGPPPPGPYNASKVEVMVHSSDKIDGAAVEQIVKKTLAENFGDSVKVLRLQDRISPVAGKGRVGFDIQINSPGVNADMIRQVLEGAGLSGYKQVVEGHRLDIGVWPIHDTTLAASSDAEENPDLKKKNENPGT